uniref:Uncharacterized protein n=1 Tax=Octactis speculum TaxID=3111310 RepID=A0A7S2AYI5_9STRA|mmetsp:Transcript_17314/g.23316  ORF Transcript_17314/g.23316 Transcript_17314/m.23316 type:complete len:504 (+) Transcript_17314:28-1539(+)
MSNYGSSEVADEQISYNNGSADLDQSSRKRVDVRALGPILILSACLVYLSVPGAQRDQQSTTPELDVFSITEIPQSERNPISNQSYFYKFTYPVANGTGLSGFEKLTKFLCPPMADPEDLGCDGLKVGCEVLISQQTTADETLHGFQLHMVDTPRFETYTGGFTIDQWQTYFTELNGNMSEFNAFQHNKVTLFTTNLAVLQQKLESENEDYMARLSGDMYAHILIQINGRIYEVIGASTSELDLAKFKAWDDSECKGAHVPIKPVSFYQNQVMELMSDWDDDAISRTAVFEEETGLPPLLFVGVSVATDSLHSLKFDSLVTDSQRFANADWSFKHYGEECVALTGEWPQMPGISVKYVHNAEATQGEQTILTYESAVTKSHSEHLAPTGNWFGWDHWLDQHIGVRNTVYDPGDHKVMCERLSREITESLIHTEMPVGERLVMGGGGDKALNQTHIYSGYHGTLAWEYNQQCYEWREESVPGICSCNAMNNDIAYFTETGVQCS